MDTNARLFLPGEDGYEARRSGFNTAVEHRPDVIVAATCSADVVGAVQLAGRSGRPVAVMNTGHGPSVPAEGAVLIRTDRMNRVDVDPTQRTARVEGGAAWRDVIAAAAPYGLAPLNGTSPHVGVVGYTLGGGVGLLARRFGFAADHVRWLDVATADGRIRHVAAGADSYPDLFWALRGAGANFGVVTALDIDLFPVATVLGGELAFDANLSEAVVRSYADWAAAVPETMASSLMLVGYPDDAMVPTEVRGRHITHVRLAFSGDDHAEGRHWVERLRDIGPRVVDTVRSMPYAEIGTIHHEPTDEPAPAFDRNILLSDFDQDACTVLSKHAGPDGHGQFLTELRAWGGALARQPAVANAVGVRDAKYSLLAIGDTDAENRARRDELLESLRPWATGMTYLNFAGVEDTSLDAVRRTYPSADFVRLQDIKAVYDPQNMFRVNFNIPPQRSSR